MHPYKIEYELSSNAIIITVALIYFLLTGGKMGTDEGH